MPLKLINFRTSCPVYLLHFNQNSRDPLFELCSKIRHFAKGQSLCFPISIKRLCKFFRFFVNGSLGIVCSNSVIRQMN